MNKPRNRFVWHPATRATVTMAVLIGFIILFYLYCEWITWLLPSPGWDFIGIVTPLVLIFWSVMYSVYREKDKVK